MSTTVPSHDAGAPDPAAATDALAEAAAVAGYAPSIHNTQPWRWRLRAGTLDLFTEPARLLEVTDPDGRLAVLSCGAALQHARLALTAQGMREDTVRLPDPAHPEHLARLTVTERIPVTPASVRLMQTVRMRHTDRRPVTGTPIGDAALAAIGRAAKAAGADLHVLNRDQVIELAAAADYAQRAESADSAWQSELAYWTGGSRPTGTGVPDSVIPADTPQTTVPGRDFGHPGELLVSSEHDRAAQYAILYGQDDETEDWLRAGEALSALWLTATEHGVSVLPLSGTVEVTSTRQALRGMLTGATQPYLVIRLGVADPAHQGPPHTPRLLPAQIIDREPE